MEVALILRTPKIPLKRSCCCNRTCVEDVILRRVINVTVVADGDISAGQREAWIHAEVTTDKLLLGMQNDTKHDSRFRAADIDALEVSGHREICSV